MQKLCVEMVKQKRELEFQLSLKVYRIVLRDFYNFDWFLYAAARPLFRYALLIPAIPSTPIPVANASDSSPGPVFGSFPEACLVCAPAAVPPATFGVVALGVDVATAVESGVGVAVGTGVGFGVAVGACWRAGALFTVTLTSSALLVTNR